MLCFYTGSKQKHAFPFPPNKYSMYSSMIFLHNSCKLGMGYEKVLKKREEKKQRNIAMLK
jgi:hypothetical protein